MNPTDGLTAFAINEREVTEEYLRVNNIEQTLNEVLNSVLIKRSEDPYSELAKLLDAQSTSQKRLIGIKLIDSFSCEGRSAVMVRLQTCRFSVDVTISTSDPWCTASSTPDGESDLNDTPSTEEMQQVLEQKLARNDIILTDQTRVDSILQSIVPIIGNATCLATSLAVLEAGAKIEGTELVHFIAAVAAIPTEKLRIPIPIINLLENTAASTLLQEIFLVPHNVKSIQRALDLSSKMIATLALHLKQGKVSPSKSGTACHALSFQDVNLIECLKSLMQSPCTSSDQQRAEECLQIGLNVFVNSDQVQTDLGVAKGDQIDKIDEIIEALPLSSIILPFDAMDISALSALEDKMRDTKLTQMDPSFTLIARRISPECIKNLDESSPMPLVLSLGQYTTVSEFIESVRYAHNVGCLVVMETTSSESLLSSEMLIALAVGLEIEYVKFGGWSQTESMLRYNSLLAIANDFFDKDDNMRSLPFLRCS